MAKHAKRAPTVNKEAVDRRKKSGWWGSQSINQSGTLKKDGLKRKLAAKSSRSKSGLDSGGVYMYVNKKNDKKYVGKAVKQTIFGRQYQHLSAASRKKTTSWKV